MKYLVLSDSHGCEYNLEMILNRERNVQAIIHLGDGAAEMLGMSEFTSDKPLYLLKGNCDSIAYGFPERLTLKDGSHGILACHGHLYNVKYGYNRLYYACCEENIEIALFGHTHTLLSEYSNGIYLFNPGAVKNGCYGILIIKENSIEPLIKSI